MYAGYFIIIASKKPFKTIIGKEKRSSFLNKNNRFFLIGW
jgi:hypothetical protein